MRRFTSKRRFLIRFLFSVQVQQLELENVETVEPTACRRSVVPDVSDLHPFLEHFTVPECSRRPFRRILGTLLFLANAEDPEMWILQDDCLLEEYCIVRARSVESATTLRNDLVVLSSALSRCSRPEYNENMFTVEKLRVYMTVLREEGACSPRKLSAALTEQLATGVTRFREKLLELESWFDAATGLVGIYRSVASSSWVAVTQYLAAAVGRLAGGRAVTR